MLFLIFILPLLLSGFYFYIHLLSLFLCSFCLFHVKHFVYERCKQIKFIIIIIIISSITVLKYSFEVIVIYLTISMLCFIIL